MALKVLKPELAAVVGAERFLAEIQTTANLKHPHILPLFDSREADGSLFFVMPYLEGESLRDRIDREKQLPVSDAVTIAAKVAGALQHAHGDRVAVTQYAEGNQDIWIKELPDGPFERPTFDPAAEAYPIWTPDGSWVTYISGELLNYNIWRRRADGTGAPELILDDPRSLLQPRWSRDGEWMVFRTTAGATGRDIVGFRPGTDSTVVSLVESEDFTEWGPALSPDGRWLAYSSNETGREEVFVRPFPDVESGRAQVSTNGGSNPLWAHDGNELFYFEGGRRLIAARFTTEPGFRVVEREPLFDLGAEYLLGDGGADFYDLSPDDQRFLIGRDAGATASLESPRYVVVENFFEDLRGVAPK